MERGQKHIRRGADWRRSVSGGRVFYNPSSGKYQEAWPQPDPSHPTYANPVIVAFFLATNLKPAGDTTAWCAAFVNWCLQRAGLPTTKSASSQSFVNQDWGQVVWN